MKTLLSVLACSAILLAASDDKKEKEREQRPAPAQHHDGAPQQHREAPQQPQPQREREVQRTAPQQQAPQYRQAPPAQPQNQAPQNTYQHPANGNNSSPNVYRPPQTTPNQPQQNTVVRPNAPAYNQGQPQPMGRGSQTFNRPAPSMNQPMRTEGPNRLYTSPTGTTAVFRGNQVRSITTPGGMQINHAGPSREVVVRRNDRTFVTNSAGHGYVQREVVVRDTRFVQRTYYVNGVSYAHVYRPVVYRGGFVVNVYTPTRYYRPGFYAYAFQPWAVPVSYRWGWYNDPWYGAYGGVYFRPYRVYPSPAFWLTDFILSTSFALAYQSRYDAGIAPAPPAQAGYYAPLSDDVKQQIAEEVRRDMAWQQSQQQQAFQSGPPPMDQPPVLADGSMHTLVAFNTLNADMGGQDCVVTEGDVMQFDAARAINGNTAALQMIWSKPGDCRSGTVVNLPIDQVQEMQNHMMEAMNQGVQQMQTQQGQNGIPPMPQEVVGSTPAPFASQLPPPDANVQTELRAQAQEANTAVSQVTQEADRYVQQPAPEPGLAPGPAPMPLAAPRPTVSKGMTLDQVVAAIGQPDQTFYSGNKQIVIYNASKIKITLDNGRVTKIE